jgi:UDP-GlcNAc3NAcA epimerase
MQKKVVTIVGARPQFIKAACLSRALKNYPIQEVIVHTGQHYDENMSDIFFKEMEIPKPTHHLTENGKLHGEMTGRMLEKIEKILLEEKPEMVVVYGDTNSTLAGALAARKLNIKICHVEAGLRNYDMTIPEDVNRILTDRISDHLFCPTQQAVDNLKKEGFDKIGLNIIRTGDIMSDAVLRYSVNAKKNKTINTPSEKFILATIHRAANTNELTLTEILNALNKLAETANIVFPVHPRTKLILENLKLKPHKNISLQNPFGYFDLLNHLNECACVITDSGGLQKEAYILGKKSLLLMEFSPWVELVKNDFSVETRSTETEILKNFAILQNKKPDFSVNLYGDGKTAETIAGHINSILHA